MKKVFLILGFFIVFFVLNLQCVNALDRYYHVGSADMVSPSTDLELAVDDTFDMQCSGTDDTTPENNAPFNWEGYLEYNSTINCSLIFSGISSLSGRFRNFPTIWEESHSSQAEEDLCNPLRESEIASRDFDFSLTPIKSPGLSV